MSAPEHPDRRVPKLVFLGCREHLWYMVTHDRRMTRRQGRGEGCKGMKEKKGARGEQEEEREELRAGGKGSGGEWMGPLLLALSIFQDLVKCLIHIISLNPHQNPMQVVILSALFLTCGDQVHGGDITNLRTCH